MAKKKKSFLPKKIAGVKVPKKVRKGQFGELLASPTGQKLIAQALLAGGAIVAGKKAADSPKVQEAAHDAKAKVADKVQAAKPAMDSGPLAYALQEAVKTFTEALQHDGGADGRSYERSWSPLPDEPAPGTRPS